MSDLPLVSIVIPVYNGANFLREAIDSALAQTYPNCEVLVVNDGSTDGGATEAIALSYGDRIRYFSKENGGVASALNRGLREMRGEYFSWLSHDDRYLPQKIARQMEFVQAQAGPCLPYGDHDVIDEFGQILRTRRVGESRRSHMVLSLIMDGPVNGCDLLIPKLCFDEIGLFNEQLKTTQDYELWVRIAEKFSFAYMPEVLIQSRIHASQGSHTIPVHHSNENVFFIWAIKRLPVFGEAKLGVRLDALFYFKLAINLSSREFQSAADFAVQQGLKQLGAFGIIPSFYAMMVYLFYLVYVKAKAVPAFRKVIKLVSRTIRKFLLV